jgi:hypothetical protein
MKKYDGKRINALLEQIKDENPEATFEQAASRVIAEEAGNQSRLLASSRIEAQSELS